MCWDSTSSALNLADCAGASSSLSRVPKADGDATNAFLERALQDLGGENAGFLGPNADRPNVGDAVLLGVVLLQLRVDRDVERQGVPGAEARALADEDHGRARLEHDADLILHANARVLHEQRRRQRVALQGV